MDSMTQFMAKQAIFEQLCRYCRSMDRRDDELGRLVFTKECRVDYGLNFKGRGWDFVSWAHKAHDRAYIQTSHQINNVLIVLDSQCRRAVSESYLDTVQLTHPDDEGHCYELHVAGRYLDKWILRDDRWQIAHRQFVQDIAELRRVEQAFPRFGGKADKTDPSYRLREWLEQGKG